MLDEEKRGTGGRRDEESEKMKKLVKKRKMKKSLKDASLASLGLVKSNITKSKFNACAAEPARSIVFDRYSAI